MRGLIVPLAVACLGAATPALAAPSVEIRDAVARVIVSPEPRTDVQVEIAHANPRLPLQIHRFGDHVTVDGGLGGRVHDCNGRMDAPSAFVFGVGQVSGDDIPQIVVHTPMDARVGAGGAIWGEVGRSTSLELASGGCGQWLVGNVVGRMKISGAGAMIVRTGQAGSAELLDAGAGKIATREIGGAVTAVDVGAGDIDVASVSGPLNVRIAGAGRVSIAGGHASLMQATIAGAGDIGLGGVADSLKATVLGSGDIHVAHVTGQVSKAIIGAGVVRVGS